MPILPVKFILFCLIAVICLGTMPGSAASNPGSSRMVNVADGVSLRLIESGKAGGEPALVFIPGWSTGADIWNHQIDTFAKHIGQSRSIRVRKANRTKTTRGNTPETRAQDLHTLLERVGVRRAVLIGWSQGVQDVAAYVERFGTKDLMGIVLVDAAVSDGADGIAARAQETAAQFKMFAVYQGHQQEYL